MSVYRETLVKSARKNHRCAGCDRFVTILAGDSYYDCFSAGYGDAGGFALCVPCKKHLDECDDCQKHCRDEIRGIAECRRETGKAVP